jgi:hypothetical protein
METLARVVGAGLRRPARATHARRGTLGAAPRARAALRAPQAAPPGAPQPPAGAAPARPAAPGGAAPPRGAPAAAAPPQQLERQQPQGPPAAEPPAPPPAAVHSSSWYKSHFDMNLFHYLPWCARGAGWRGPHGPALARPERAAAR